MLTIRNLKKTVGGRTLFEEASMQINYGERVALVGPNGAGKSTLFSIILRENEPDAGTVERDEWTMVGFLPQEAEAVGDETVLQVATGKQACWRSWNRHCVVWRKPERWMCPSISRHRRNTMP
ncbi:MAG: ABC-F family ATP-binding cassette domain-containing protein [Verrucomicrobiae bacterium]|nr:ABC-F family ATP-binding cassette domain-containing protein [Verrucomicrobiae bacterium]